jgi:hypothetical protein
MSRRAFLPLLSLLCVGAAGCGAGPYGFSKTYVPLDAEAAYDSTSTESGYEDVNNDPAAYENEQIAWFGIVEKLTLAEDGRYRIELSHRKHRPRHLCSSDADDSCRVTVHSESAGGFTALVQLKTEDTAPGLDKVQTGTLLRVFGKVRCRMNEDNERQECDHDERGGVVLDVSYYRQWPARYFVTTRAADSMRR